MRLAKCGAVEGESIGDDGDATGGRNGEEALHVGPMFCVLSHHHDQRPHPSHHHLNRLLTPFLCGCLEALAGFVAWEGFTVSVAATTNHDHSHPAYAHQTPPPSPQGHHGQACLPVWNPARRRPAA